MTLPEVPRRGSTGGTGLVHLELSRAFGLTANETGLHQKATAILCWLFPDWLSSSDPWRARRGGVREHKLQHVVSRCNPVMCERLKAVF